MARTKQSEHKKDLRRKLRNDPTRAELKLWAALQRRQMKGLKFRRQHGIGPYIVDFFCPEEKLAVELDGDVHATPGRQIADVGRSNYLNKLGVRVIRYMNDDILNNLTGVLEDLRSKV